MAREVTFKKVTTLNGIEYKKGQKLKVSSSIYEMLKSEGRIVIKTLKKEE